MGAGEPYKSVPSALYSQRTSADVHNIANTQIPVPENWRDKRYRKWTLHKHTPIPTGLSGQPEFQPECGGLLKPRVYFQTPVYPMQLIGTTNSALCCWYTATSAMIRQVNKSWNVVSSKNSLFGGKNYWGENGQSQFLKFWRKEATALLLLIILPHGGLTLVFVRIKSPREWRCPNFPRYFHGIILITTHSQKTKYFLILDTLLTHVNWFCPFHLGTK